MSIERELLRKLFESGMLDRLSAIEVGQLLAQPEQEEAPVTNEPTATTTAMAVMPNGVCVSNVYDAYEAGRQSAMVEQKPEQTEPEQEPVAWRYKTHNRYTYAEENYHELEGEGEPLYTSPQKREPLSDEERQELANEHRLKSMRGEK